VAVPFATPFSLIIRALQYTAQTLESSSSCAKRGPAQRPYTDMKIKTAPRGATLKTWEAVPAWPTPEHTTA